MAAKKRKKKDVTDEQRLEKQRDVLLDRLIEVLVSDSLELDQNVRVEIEFVDGEGQVCVEPI